MTFNDYYHTEYLPRHREFSTRVCHYAGVIATILFVVVCVISNAWLWLLAAPFVAYPFAVPAHYLFEGNQPAFFSSNPLYAKLSDFRMFYEGITGQLDPSIIDEPS